MDNRDASVKPLWEAQRSEQTQVSLQASPHQDDLWGGNQSQGRWTGLETARDTEDQPRELVGAQSKIQGSPLSSNFRKGFAGG